MLNKTHGHIDFNKSAKEIELLVRGLNPWPSAYTSLANKGFKIWKADVIESDVNKDTRVTKDMFKAKCGEVIYVDKKSLLVNTKDGILDLLEVQLEGKKRMFIEDFLRGYSVNVGEVLGE